MRILNEYYLPIRILNLFKVWVSDENVGYPPHNGIVSFIVIIESFFQYEKLVIRTFLRVVSYCITNKTAVSISIFPAKTTTQRPYRYNTMTKIRVSNMFGTRTICLYYIWFFDVRKKMKRDQLLDNKLSSLVTHRRNRSRTGWVTIFDENARADDSKWQNDDRTTILVQLGDLQ